MPQTQVSRTNLTPEKSCFPKPKPRTAESTPKTRLSGPDVSTLTTIPEDDDARLAFEQQEMFRRVEVGPSRPLSTSPSLMRGRGGPSPLAQSSATWSQSPTPSPPKSRLPSPERIAFQASPLPLEPEAKNKRLLWPRALTFAVAATSLHTLAIRALPKSHLVTQPVGAVVCWAVAASLLVGSRVQARASDSRWFADCKEGVMNVASLVLWTLPILLRAGAPLQNSQVGLVAALACGIGVTLGILVTRAFLKTHPTLQAEAQVTFKQGANCISYLSLVSPLGGPWGRGITIAAAFAGIVVGALDTGHPKARRPLATETDGPDTNAWRRARDEMLTASELAVRIAFVIRLAAVF